jgi:cytochrome c biogenesis protein CcmG/thiol:disulfide interchange protein DsbE
MTSSSTRRILLLAPLGLAAAAGGGFYAMLQGLRTGDYDPRRVSSALIGRPVPEFAALPPLEGAGVPSFSSADLRARDRPVLVNFWASWCVPCLVEHPQLTRLAREGVPVFGVSYKDTPTDALDFLGRNGNPFARLGSDQTGRVGIEWGVYGLPETFLVDRGGIVRWRQVGAITEEILRRDLRPFLRRHA